MVYEKSTSRGRKALKTEISFNIQFVNVLSGSAYVNLASRNVKNHVVNQKADDGSICVHQNG